MSPPFGISNPAINPESPPLSPSVSVQSHPEFGYSPASPDYGNGSTLPFRPGTPFNRGGDQSPAVAKHDCPEGISCDTAMGLAKANAKDGRAFSDQDLDYLRFKGDQATSNLLVQYKHEQDMKAMQFAHEQNIKAGQYAHEERMNVIELEHRRRLVLDAQIHELAVMAQKCKMRERGDEMQD